jgi:hypothetical protein
MPFTMKDLEENEAPEEGKVQMTLPPNINEALMKLTKGKRNSKPAIIRKMIESCLRDLGEIK